MSKFKAYEKVCEYLADNPPKECPYCGGIPVPDYLSEERFMVCEECGARGPEKDTFITAATAWNERPTVWQDAEIARLKARVAGLEKPDAFWSISDYYDDPAKDSLGEVYDAGEEDPLIPLEVLCSAQRPSIWLVLEHIPVDDDEVDWDNLWHRFPTKEEAEAFCQKLRAEKGEGE